MSAETWAFAIMAFVAGIGFGAALGLLIALWFPPGQLRNSAIAQHAKADA